QEDAVGDFELDRSGDARTCVGVVGIDALVEDGEGDRAIHRARVEHLQIQRATDPARHRGLPRARRTVDGHDASHGDPASRSRSAANAGYDTATLLQPRTRLSPSTAFAAIAAAIATR